MNKNMFKNLYNVSKTFVTKHSPEILTGFGIAGMVGAGVLAVTATPKALRLIEQKKQEEKKDKLKPIETVKVAGKCYIPAVATAVVSAGCLIGANSVHLRRNAALAAAYKISELSLKEFKESAKEIVGEKKVQDIKDKVVEKKLEKDPVVNKEVIITDRGTTLCYDYFSGRYFQSDIDAIKKAEIELNYKLMNEMYISLNEFYDLIGLETTDAGNMLGWNMAYGKVDFEYSSHLASDGRPCLAISYSVAPRYDFSKLM